MATINGTAGDDNLYGTGDSDTINGGDGNDSLRGLAGADFLYGGAGNDFLDGGDGADFMAGGLGNDTYVVNNVGDYIQEFAGEGIDSVLSFLQNYRLGTNLEILRLGGTGNINGQGNELDNSIMGNSGNNSLDGGAGNDNIFGMAGDDILRGGDGNDYLNGGAGIDEATYTNATGKITVDLSNTGWQNTTSKGIDVLRDIENLAGSAYDDVLAGNAVANKINAGAGDDVIRGRAGDDDLTGGTGADIFVFEGTATNGVDTIRTFETGTDTLAFNSADGYDIAAGFTLGSAASGPGAQFVYNDVTNELFYDADGDGAGAAVKLATVFGDDVAAGDILIL